MDPHEQHLLLFSPLYGPFPYGIPAASFGTAECHDMFALLSDNFLLWSSLEQANHR